MGGVATAAAIAAPRNAGGDVVATLRNVSKVFRTGDAERLALDDVSVDVRAGRFVTVMGPSGSGKSTLLHVMGGLATPTQGAVSVCGHDLASASDRTRADLRRHAIGFVFQAFNLVPVLNVAENVALPAQIAGERRRATRAHIDELLELVQLAGRGNDMPTGLSGGEQQRVALARALVMSPRLILADEPTGNLDSTAAVDVMMTLRRLQQETGTTVVVVTHDARAGAFGDEVVLLRDGRVADRLTLDGWTPPEAEGLALQRFGDDRASEILAWLQTGDGTRGRARRR